jgi:hypothetical protein
METIEIIKLVIAIILALYEVVIRLIPTEGKWSIVHKVIEFIKWISEKLDNAGDRAEARQAKAVERENKKLVKMQMKAKNKIK